MSENINYKNIIESILFAVGESISLKEISNAIELSEKETEGLLKKLQSEYDYQLRGIKIVRLDDSFQMVSRKDYFEYIKKILKEYTVTTLSQAALETLAIVAYRQPVTRSEIEQIRGVSSTSSLDLLIDRGLAKSCGKLDMPGKPSVFKTTKEFLKFAEIEKIEDLPSYEEFMEKQLELDNQSQKELIEEII